MCFSILLAALAARNGEKQQMVTVNDCQDAKFKNGISTSRLFCSSREYEYKAFQNADVRDKKEGDHIIIDLII